MRRAPAAVTDTFSAENRTEQATPRRLEKAREEGQIVRAHAIAGVAVLLVGTGVIALAGAKLVEMLEQSLRYGLSLDPENMRETGQLFAAAAQIAKPGLMIVAPFLLLMAAVGFVADLAVGGWSVSTKPVMPDFTRIDPLKGFGRLFSQQALAEIVKALVKFVVVGAVAAWLMRAWISDFLHVARRELAPRAAACRGLVGGYLADPGGLARGGDPVRGALPGLAAPPPAQDEPAGPQGRAARSGGQPADPAPHPRAAGQAGARADDVRSAEGRRRRRQPRAFRRRAQLSRRPHARAAPRRQRHRAHRVAHPPGRRGTRACR